MQVVPNAAEKPRQIYLAGFDVFRPDAAEHGAYLKALCAERGLVGLYPSDGVTPDDLLRAQDTARWICNANLALIRKADAVVANLNDFRGPGEPDAGTAFEVGFAIALGKPVWAYRSDEKPLIERAAVHEHSGVSFCTRGFVVENYDLPVNLMLACTVRLVTGDAAACLDAMCAAARPPMSSD